MNGLVAAFLAVSGTLLLVLPRRWAALPLLLATCYIPFGPEISVGPFHFKAIRILIAIGMLRASVRGEGVLGSANRLDIAMFAWSAWLVISALFHEEPAAAVIFRLGLVYDACGIYLLIRSFCRTVDDVVNVAFVTSILLVPLALEMAYETATGSNIFSAFGGVGEVSMVRNGRVRANGPFGHPILTGTIGAVCVPLMIGLRGFHSRAAGVGLGACVAIVLFSASSGPILSGMAGLVAVYFWRYRYQMRALRWAAVLGYVALDVVMKDPAYFLVARLDLAGGSTSWYRARLIQSAFEHLSEWWLFGTDRTNHWMWVVVQWSPNHTDITSHYIQLGVHGGLPLIGLFAWVLTRGFGGIGQAVTTPGPLTEPQRYMLWAVGASLFAHFATMFSVSYFDQSFVFLYLPLAMASAVAGESHVKERLARLKSTFSRRTPTAGEPAFGQQTIRPPARPRFSSAPGRNARGIR